MISNSKMKMSSSQTSLNRSTGFTLLELLVAITFVGILCTYGIMSTRRYITQGEVDRYTQFLKTGLFSLRSRLAKSKAVCSFNLNQDLATTEFGAPWKVVEFKQPDGSRSDTERLKCCWNADKENLFQCTAIELNEKPAYRFLAVEGTRESKEVEVAALQAKYELIPSGISAQQYNQLTILVRSRHGNNEPRLRTRCIELSGSAQIHSGTWNDDTDFCDTS